MKTVHFLKIALLFLVLGSLANTGCRASVDVGHPRHSLIQSNQMISG